MTNLNLVFDVDGVVCTGSPFTVHLEREYSIAPQRLARFFVETFPDCLVGRKDLATEIAPLLPTLGWRESPRAFLDFWFQREHVVDTRLLACVAMLRAKGVPCHLGTNQEKHRIAYLRNEIGLATVFDRVFASSELGAVKPNLEFFAKVTEMLACDPRQIVLIDDSKKNVAAATAFGWRSLHYRTAADLEGYLADLNQKSLKVGTVSASSTPSANTSTRQDFTEP